LVNIPADAQFPSVVTSRSHVCQFASAGTSAIASAEIGTSFHDAEIDAMELAGKMVVRNAVAIM
jgi:hypothetical protein